MSEEHWHRGLLRSLPAVLLSIFLPLAAWGDEPTPPKPIGQPIGMSLSLSTTFQKLSHEPQDTVLSVLTASYDLTDRWGAFARLGLVDNDPATGEAGRGMSNPALGFTYGRPLSDRYRLGLTLGVVLPLGSGGGDDPDPAVLNAMLVATDWGGPMYGPDHLTPYVGASLTRSAGPLTLRARSTLYDANRVKGEKADPIGPTVIFTSSDLLADYSINDRMSVFTQLAQTYYHNTPPFVAADATARADHYLVGGVSFNFKLANGRSFQPSLAYGEAIDQPKTRRTFRLLELGTKLSF
jgi:hypothetical protein